MKLESRTAILYWLTATLTVFACIASALMWFYRDVLARFPYDSF
jgi:hypothetical protein